jgi:hypothetical protein
MKYKSNRELYLDALRLEASVYVEIHDGSDVVWYLNYKAGKLLTAYMVKKSPADVYNDLIRAIQEQKQ